MAQKPIRTPVGGRTELDRLKESNPAAYAKYLNVKLDAPLNFRDGHERKKRPFRNDDPLRKQP